MRRMVMLAALGALVAVTLSACGGGSGTSDGRAATAAVSSEQVQAIAANMLTAYNLGDYGAFSRDLSLPAKLIVNEDVFAEFRTENLPVTGPYMAITSVQREPGQQDANHASYRVRARFQYQHAAVLLTVARSGEVDGLELYPETSGRR
jgi:hypothetical protein